MNTLADIFFQLLFIAVLFTVSMVLTFIGGSLLGAACAGFVSLYEKLRRRNRP